ncbi:MAG: hypothetical protein HC894_32245 [Microcoleus sp. SM1_3_4]|nr:hypothetical protein [Microcoleus sp. SM1_3_4]
MSLKTVQRWEKGKSKVSQFYIDKLIKFMETYPGYSLYFLKFEVS